MKAFIIIYVTLKSNLKPWNEDLKLDDTDLCLRRCNVGLLAGLCTSQMFSAGWTCENLVSCSNNPFAIWAWWILEEKQFRHWSRNLLIQNLQVMFRSLSDATGSHGNSLLAAVSHSSRSLYTENLLWSHNQSWLVFPQPALGVETAFPSMRYVREWRLSGLLDPRCGLSHVRYRWRPEDLIGQTVR